MSFGVTNLPPVKKFILLGSAMFVAFGVTGCASVKVSSPLRTDFSQQKQATKERTTLIKATRDLSATPWPAVEELSLADRMFGQIKGKEISNMTRNKSLQLYTSQLISQPNPKQALLIDANQTLSRARRVAEIGRQTTKAIKPNDNDIALLEEAIAEVRACREMYLAAMKQLKKQGIAISKEDQMELKEAFTQTIKDIGLTADGVADQIALGLTYQQYTQKGVSGAAN